MKNNKKVFLIIVSIILIFIILGFILNGIERNISKEEKVVKGMSETTQIVELQSQLANLEKEKEEYATKVQNYKTSIAQAITDKGVETASDADIETIVNNISSIKTVSSDSNRKNAIYLGTGASGSYNIKELYPDIDYTTITADNFLLGATAWWNASPTFTIDAGNYSYNHKFYGCGGLNISKSYNNTTGVFTYSLSANEQLRFNFGNTYFRDSEDYKTYVTLSSTPIYLIY